MKELEEILTSTVRLSQDGIFWTLQGEGPLVGVPSLFIRLDTCNLRCKWGDTLCDASYTSWHPHSRRLTLQDLLLEVEYEFNAVECGHVVITGGEPTLQADAVRAIANLCNEFDIHTTIETNGTHYLDNTKLDLICISPKLKSSTPVGTKYEKMHAEHRWNPNAILEWMRDYEYYFKFVIDKEEDFDEMAEMLREVNQPLNEPQHVVVMPEGITSEELWGKSKWLAEKCKEIGCRFTPRIQIDIWGNRPGT